MKVQLWYFLFFTLLFFSSYLIKTLNIIGKEKYFYLKKLSIFSFSYLLLVGLITQIIKHLVGRPRPNHSQLDGGFEFNFFSTESSFHSFPSTAPNNIAAHQDPDYSPSPLERLCILSTSAGIRGISWSTPYRRIDDDRMSVLHQNSRNISLTSERPDGHL